MILPSYNFAMSISKYFDDYEVKTLCAREFKSIYMDCSEPCEYYGLIKPQKHYLPFSFYTSTKVMLSKKSLVFFQLYRMRCVANRRHIKPIQ